MFSKKEFGIVSNLRLISMKNFVLSRVEHEKSFTTSGLERYDFWHYGSNYSAIYGFVLIAAFAGSGCYAQERQTVQLGDKYA